MHPDFEAVIGLEIHCQLSTQSKLFSATPARPPQGKSVADVQPNAQASVICAAHPGTLPVLNKKAVELAVRAGLATRCRINPVSVFARKQYFYPDLPKGYQISQYDRPICEGGRLEVEDSDGKLKTIHIQRIHMEEDAGKTVHHSGYSLVNLNRAGVPLIEVVSAPDLSTPAEAGAYMRQLHSVLTAIGVTDGNMQEGNFRCDANVSVRRRGDQVLGTRAEIKNVNSFRFVEKAIEYEINRQISVVSAGGRIVQETRLWDADRGQTFSMRSKEEAHDYRYFPDPDLLPLVLDASWIEQIRSELPELPEQKKQRYIQDYGLSAYDAGILTSDVMLSSLFELILKATPGSTLLPKLAANWVAGEVLRIRNEGEKELLEEDKNFLARTIADLVRLTQDQTISSTGAKQAFQEAYKTRESIDQVVTKLGLKQINDTGALEAAVQKVIEKFPAQVQELQSGKDKVIGFLVGQAMKETQGKANPAMLSDLIRKKVKGDSSP